MTTENRAAQTKEGPTLATICVWLFAVSAIWHYTSSGPDIQNYFLQYVPVRTPLVVLSMVTAFIAALFPNRAWAVVLFAGGQFISISGLAPFVADHLVMELFLSLSIIASFIYLALKGRTTKISTSEMFNIFGPVGRWLLIIMYFYGTFHKINPGFLSPLSSCALPFINGFPLPDAILGSLWVQYAAIYGTLILESIAMLMLLSARTKYFGMLLGMSFHFIIGISGYGTLAHFSAFALSLHAQFLPSNFGHRIYAEKRIPAALKNETNFRILTILLVVAQLAFAVNLAITRDGFVMNSLFAVFGLTLLFLVFKHGQVRANTAPYKLKSPLLALNLVPVWFFVHCMSPYLGLGTGGALTMFSGLRTEGGISNHYIITKPLHLFTYQDEVVYFEEASNSSLQRAAAGKQGLVMFDFQRHFTYREALQIPLTLRIGDEILPINDIESFNAFANAHFKEQSWLERKYMSFRLVDGPKPDQCRH